MNIYDELLIAESIIQKGGFFLFWESPTFVSMGRHYGQIDVVTLMLL
jgi:hypothetical protein